MDLVHVLIQNFRFVYFSRISEFVISQKDMSRKRLFIQLCVTFPILFADGLHLLVPTDLRSL